MIRKDFERLTPEQQRALSPSQAEEYCALLRMACYVPSTPPDPEDYSKPEAPAVPEATVDVLPADTLDVLSEALEAATDDRSIEEVWKHL
jgi:hypothetical protein